MRASAHPWRGVTGWTGDADPVDRHRGRRGAHRPAPWCSGWCCAAAAGSACARPRSASGAAAPRAGRHLQGGERLHLLRGHRAPRRRQLAERGPGAPNGDARVRPAAAPTSAAAAGRARIAPEAAPAAAPPDAAELRPAQAPQQPRRRLRPPPSLPSAPPLNLLRPRRSTAAAPSPAERPAASPGVGAPAEEPLRRATACAGARHRAAGRGAPRRRPRRNAPAPAPAAAAERPPTAPPAPDEPRSATARPPPCRRPPRPPTHAAHDGTAHDGTGRAARRSGACARSGSRGIGGHRPAAPTEDIDPAEGRLERLRGRLSRSRSGFGQGLLGLLGAGELDEESWEDVEAMLLQADLGPEMTVGARRDPAHRARPPRRPHPRTGARSCCATSSPTRCAPTSTAPSARCRTTAGPRCC